jgi:CSLREA domain-containing protein
MSSPFSRRPATPRRRRPYRLLLEPLEDRLVPATFVVNSTLDLPDINPGDGICNANAGSGAPICTLRAAIMEANATAGADIIMLPAGTYTLTLAGRGENAAATGDLDITEDLTIIGDGAAVTIVQAGTTPGSGIDRVFEVLDVQDDGGVGPTNATFFGITIQNGVASDYGGVGDGGGINHTGLGLIQVLNSVVANNSATVDGGGIASDGSLTVINSTVRNNTAADDGGGINVANRGILTIQNSSIQDNMAGDDYGGGRGGGVRTSSSATITGTTFSGNSASHQGGGFWTKGTDTTFTNVTFSGNSADDYGGGLYIRRSINSLSLLNATIASNSAPLGGGLFVESDGGEAMLTNTILADNTGGNVGGGTITSGGNNLEDANDAGFTGPGDLINTDPLLGPLQDNGGPTQTRALLTGSPAIDTANTTLAPATDQRGITRPQGAAADIGAFEFVPPAPVAAPGIIVVGTDFGAPPNVKVFAADGTLIASFLAYDRLFIGGVRVATGDVNGDTVPDIITAAGPGASPHIKVFDGTKLNQTQPNGQLADSALLASFFAFSPGFSGGIFVASGDVNNDGFDDIIVGSGPGAVAHVKVIDGTRLQQTMPGGQIADSALLASFFPYGLGFAGGVTVAAGDTNGDGLADVITGAGPGAPPLVRVVDATRLTQTFPNGTIADSALLASFLAFNPALFLAGVNVGAGDINGDGFADVLLTTGPGAGNILKIVNGNQISVSAPDGQIADTSLQHFLFPFDQNFSQGVRLTATDLDGDGFDDLIVGKGGMGFGFVRAFSGKGIQQLGSSTLPDPTQLLAFFAYANYTGGVFVG